MHVLSTYGEYLQEYLGSGRSMQLVLESVCDPWQIFEVDWNYR